MATLTAPTIAAPIGNQQYPPEARQEPERTDGGSAVGEVLAITAELVAGHLVLWPWVTSSELGGYLTAAARLWLGRTRELPLCGPSGGEPLAVYRCADQAREVLARYLGAAGLVGEDSGEQAGQVIRAWVTSVPVQCLIPGLRAAGTVR